MRIEHLGNGVIVLGDSEIGPKAGLGDGTRVHSACVEGYVGKNCYVWRWAHIMANSVIGDDCMIAQGVFIADDVVIGNRCRIQNFTTIPRKTRIGNDVYLGSHVAFCNSKYPRSGGDSSERHLPIIIEDEVTIGSHAVIMPVRIGRGAMIGAGAIVTKDVESGKKVVGVPAREDGWSCYLPERQKA